MIFCMAEGCLAGRTHPIRADGDPLVCERHVNGAVGWVSDRKKRVEAAATPIFASYVNDPEATGAALETAADLAIDEAEILVDRLDARFR